MDCWRARQLLGDRCFISWVAPPPVIGEKSDLLLPGQMAEDVKRSNLAARIDRQQFPCLDPEYFHPSLSLPAQSFIGLASFGAPLLFQIYQIDYEVFRAKVRLQNLAVDSASADDNHLSLLEHFFEIC